MSGQEVRLWVRLRALRAEGFHFRRQPGAAGLLSGFHLPEPTPRRGSGWTSPRGTGTGCSRRPPGPSFPSLGLPNLALSDPCGA
ncbi:hypothetical protein [Caulobacter sp. UNC279MFTsu5.1]|uniref:hypothetical protein n=1 Tax=Caulobacter sp. UNC279MFTsu5.1 TaxID=1502775 RepID=UPI001160C961|nr:hypothetical protein [Caulobacter sp. UNC279MFTsu5.1]